MAKVELKTKLSGGSVDKFLDGITDERQRTDARKLVKIFEQTTGEKAKMWGPAIIGFGQTHLKYVSGRELDWMLTGFSPRKGRLTLYITGGIEKLDRHLPKLGKYKTGKGCLYLKHLADVDENVLANLIKDSVRNG